MQIDFESMLSKILQHPAYSHFTEQPEAGKHRPRKDGSNSSPEVLSVLGYFNHETGEKRSIPEIIKELGLSEQQRQPPPLKKTPPDLDKIYDRCGQKNDVIKLYFSRRGLDLSDDLISEIGLKTEYIVKDKSMRIIVPMKNYDGKIIQLTRIYIDENYKKTAKKMRGVAVEDRATLILRNPERLAIFEGLEDGLSYLLHSGESDSVLICYGTAGFSKISSFCDNFRSCGCFLDPDPGEQSLKASTKLPAKVGLILPKMIGVDANQALQNGVFKDWINSYEKVNRDEQLQAPIVNNQEITIGYEADVIDEMNKIHFGVLIGNTYRYGYKQFLHNSDKYELRLLKKHDFEAIYSDSFIDVGVNAKGDTIYKTYAEYWMKHRKRKKYDKLVFKPSSIVYPNEFNVWQGFDIDKEKYKLSQSDNCRNFLDFILEIICSGSESLFNFVLDWCADAVQYPEEKQGVALVLKSEEEGTGKSFFTERFGDLFGPHFLLAAKKDMVIGRFSGHLDNNLVLGAEEAVYAGDPNARNILKDMVTSKTRNIERKGVDAEINKPNFTRLIFISNEDHVISASATDRRFQVIEVSTAKIQNREYFQGLLRHWKAGEKEAFLKYLMERDVGKTDLAKSRILTEEAIHQIELSLPSWEKWIKGFLDDGFFEYKYFDDFQKKYMEIIFEFSENNEVVSDYLYSNYIDFCNVKKIKYPKVKAEITVLLKKIFKDMKITRKRIGGAKRTMWDFTSYGNMISLWNAKRVVKIKLDIVDRPGQSGKNDAAQM